MNNALDPPLRATVDLGGVPTPSHDELLAMQRGDYVLRARDGALTKVPVEKSTLPRDPEGHIQQMTVKLAPDGTVYANQPTMTCKSTDGGRTWTRYECDDKLFVQRPENRNARHQILSDGTFVAVTLLPKNGGDLAEVWASGDAGRSFEKLSTIGVPGEFDEFDLWATPLEMFRLPDDTLIWGVEVRNSKYTIRDGIEDKWVLGKHMNAVFRSVDRGVTWEGPCHLSDWTSDGGIARMASGRLLATLRYQRAMLPGDPPELMARTGASISPFGTDWPYKHVMLVDSEDGGRTWTKHRLLTSLFGQCFGFPAGLSDGTAVVVHDHRYPRLPSAARAMVSHDEGQTWENEVYYMFAAAAVSGFNRSVVLPDDVVLTLGGVCDRVEDLESSHGVQGNSDIVAIRWKPVTD